MFHIRKEGETIRNGFNFYPLRDKMHFGFIFRYDTKISQTNLRSKLWSFRYSKTLKKFFINHTNYDTTT